MGINEVRAGAAHVQRTDKWVSSVPTHGREMPGVPQHEAQFEPGQVETTFMDGTAQKLSELGHAFFQI